jgi:hypothetical protein
MLGANLDLHARDQVGPDRHSDKLVTPLFSNRGVCNFPALDIGPFFELLKS